MNVSDSDLSMLELMLDGELPEEAAETLRASMEHDKDLAAAWEALQGERAARLAIWHDDQPSQQRANMVASRVLRKIQHDRTWIRWGLVARLGGAVAACMVLGFGVGWYGRGVRPVVPTQTAQGIQGQSASADYRVELTDDKGRPVAVQPFQSLDQAVQFANDVNQWKTAQRHNGGTTVVPVLDQY
jgi:anti-sigma factor RsiW